MKPASLRDRFYDLLDNKSYQLIQELDQELDKFFHINHCLIEHTTDEFYPTLSRDALSTPYIDYFQILTDLAPGETLVDLGAGYCRGTLLSHFLNLSPCLSVEALADRSKPAKKALAEMGGDGNLIVMEDIIDFKLQDHFVYYLYFPLGRAFFKTLKRIIKRNSPAIFYVTESHGDMITFFEHFEGCEREKTFLCMAPRHHQEIVKFKLNPQESRWDDSSALLNWYILFFDQALVLEFDYYHLLQKQKVHHYTLLEDLELVFYNNKWCLQHQTTNRIYHDQEFKIKNIYRLAQIQSPVLVEALLDPAHKYRKIFYSDHLFVE